MMEVGRMPMSQVAIKERREKPPRRSGAAQPRKRAKAPGRSARSNGAPPKAGSASENKVARGGRRLASAFEVVSELPALAEARRRVTLASEREGSSPAELAEAIRRVHVGDAVFSPLLAGFVLDAFAGSTPPSIDPELDQLTQREREVLRYIARGYAYKEVARELAISVKTVETHVSAVLHKLQLSNRYELSRWASDRRLV
jgi:DNA-binding CsgD family transcriptional regulator